MKNVDLIRRYMLKKVNELRMYVSMLNDEDCDVKAKFYGVEGAKTASSIADFTLVQLGHVPPDANRDGNPAKSPTYQQARKIMPDEAARPQHGRK